ncbi:hypothetical protein XENTR_v10022428 [Xenopus tropicalis]|nr:hypothetical protein XENTR_v10022428 [Xenopus tropicalis]
MNFMYIDMIWFFSLVITFCKCIISTSTWLPVLSALHNIPFHFTLLLLSYGSYMCSTRIPSRGSKEEMQPLLQKI